jgi:hypothetical protein
MKYVSVGTTVHVIFFLDLEYVIFALLIFRVSVEKTGIVMDLPLYVTWHFSLLWLSIWIFLCLCTYCFNYHVMWGGLFLMLFVFKMLLYINDYLFLRI